MNKILTLLLILCLLPACSDSLTEENQPHQQTTQLENKLIGIAQKAIAECHPGRANEIQVANVIPCPSRMVFKKNNLGRAETIMVPDTMIYLVNFQNQNGCVIVSDCELISDAIAIIPENNLSVEDITDDDALSYYFELFLDSYLLGSIGNTFSEDDVQDIMSTYANSETDDEEWHTRVTYSKSNIVAKWGTGNPYNMYCFTPSGNAAQAYYADVAVAQLLTFYEQPVKINGYNIDWANLHFTYPSNKAQAEAVGRLVHEIGVLNHTIYDEDLTWRLDVEITDDLGTFYPVSTLEPLKDSFNYICELFPTEEKMIHNIIDYGPALLSGTALDEDGNEHRKYTWVVDGAQARSRTINQKYEYRFFYRCNWGNNGKNNGYFLSTAFNPLGPYSNYHINHHVYTTYFIEKK
ncbi:MAG: C10 family peptidase [Muribaculaceae bacterium]|nr:C10 family peptidase [Muribaculaceae bacterium]